MSARPGDALRSTVLVISLARSLWFLMVTSGLRAVVQGSGDADVPGQQQDGDGQVAHGHHTNSRVRESTG
jgi:hypothetical protein